MKSDQLNKFPKVKEHLKNLVPRASEWALFYRRKLLTRGNNTDNYCEANIKIIKDKILGRLKAFNPVQLVDFILTRYDDYIHTRIIDVLNNRALNPFKSRFYFRPEKLADLKCEQVDPEIHPNTYRVQNLTKTTTYFVLMDHEVCSCEAGKSGAACKHMCAVVQQFKLSSSIIHPLLQCDNPTLKLILFEIAHGHSNVPDSWFASLHSEVQGNEFQVMYMALMHFI